MNWSINIILLQLLSQVLSDNFLPCIKWKCSVSENNTYMIKERDTSFIKADLLMSSIKIYGVDHNEWELSFNQINITTLSYEHCSWNLIHGIHDRNSLLGISQVENIILTNFELDGNLTGFYLSNLISVKTLEINQTKNLKLTNESFEGISNLEKLFLRNNGIKEIPNGVFKFLTHLEILDLGQNDISKINSELFYGIPLKHLNLNGNNLKTLSLNTPSLMYLDVSNQKKESIINKLVNKNSFNIYNIYLTNLIHLHNVRLESFDLTVVPENMIWNSPNITKFSLASNRLKELPEKFFLFSTNINELNLNNNNIKKISNNLLEPLKKLEKLDLSYNKIVEIEWASLCLPELKDLILANINLNNVAINTLQSSYIFSSENLPKVENIDLSLNNILNFKQKWLTLKNLKVINLSRNKISSLGVSDIQFVSRDVEVNLESNPLKFIDLSQLVIFASVQEKQKSIKPRKIYVSSNAFVCDCRNYEFANFINGKMPYIVYNELEIDENLFCHDDENRQFSSINTDTLTCDWEIFEDSTKTNNCSGCECTYRPHDNSALMDCSNKHLNTAPEQIISSQRINYIELNLSNNFITDLPDYNQLNIRKLNVSHNNLTTINLIELPKNLEELHMEYNNLSDISEMDMTNGIMSLTKLNHITMENSLACKRNDKVRNIFNFVKKYSSKIDDLGSFQLSCFFSFLNMSQTVEEISHAEYADNYKITISIIIVVAKMLTVLGILLALYKIKKTKIVLWLYSHYKLWPISKESFDKNKKYDAFLSFSHKDQEFVANNLVPRLEEGNMPFKLCLPYRDWIPGDFIPAQIARSVDESRRTIIVLTKSYLDSIWGLPEFRTAYSSALNKRRNQIIVILYGDISIEDLDPELKAYLSMNTDIRWGDHWFWEKLKYTLSHVSNTAVNDRTKIIVPDKLNPLQLI